MGEDSQGQPTSLLDEADEGLGDEERETLGLPRRIVTRLLLDVGLVDGAEMVQGPFVDLSGARRQRLDPSEVAIQERP